MIAHTLLALVPCPAPVAAHLGIASGMQQPPAKPAEPVATSDEFVRIARAIQADIEALRGQKFVQEVPVKRADKATLLKYIQEREALETTPERGRFQEECAKLLGLIPADMDLKAVTRAFLDAQVGGFYDPPTKTFYVMETFDGELARVIMSHEFVHALDDQLYDLDGTAKKLGDDSDRLQAFWSLCEGSGTYTMSAWMMGHLGELNREALLEVQRLSSAGMQDLPPYVWKPALGAYTAGQAFVTKAKPKRAKVKEGETEQPAPSYSEMLGRLFQEPPHSTEQILHPEKYFDAEQRDDPRGIEFVLTRLPDGWQVLGQDTLGEMQLALLTMPLDKRHGIDANNLMALAGLKYTDAAASGWDGDRVILLGKDDARCLQLVTVWDSERDAVEFQEAVEPILKAQATTEERGIAYSLYPPAEVNPGERPESWSVTILLGTKGTLATLGSLPWRVSP